MGWRQFDAENSDKSSKEFDHRKVQKDLYLQTDQLLIFLFPYYK